MAVSNLVVKQDYVGNGVTTTFAIPFTYKSTSSIKVYLINSTTGVSTLQVLSTNYTLDNPTAPTNILMNVAPAVGNWLRVIRVSPIVQNTELENNGEFLEEEFEAALDKITLMVQEISSRTDSALLLNPVNSAISPVLPPSSANAVLGVNGTNTAYVWRPAADFVGPTGPTGATGATGATGPTGATGATGATGYGLFVASGVPSNGLGNNGDVYINTLTWTMYYKVTGAWVAQGTLRGPQGDPGAMGPQGPAGTNGTNGADGAQGIPGADGSMIYSGTGVPSNALGKDSDLYIDIVSPSNLYQRLSGVWVLRNQLQGLQGPPGVDGAIGPTAFGLFIQSGVPNNGFGNNNDVYIDTNTYILYYKISGVWQPQGSLRPPGFQPAGTTGQVLRKASNTDYDTEWHTPVKADVGLGNVDNTSDANKPVSTATQTALNGKQATLPAGTNGQHLVLAGGVPAWVNQDPALPVGGTTGQALIKASNSDGDATWQTLPSGLPSQTGQAGEYLRTDGTNATWEPIPNDLPTGGTTGQILTKSSGTNYDAAWATPVEQSMATSATQTIASGGNAVLQAVKRQLIRVQVTGGGSFVLPAPAADGYELFIMGVSNSNIATLSDGATAAVNGPIEFFANRMEHFIADGTTKWVRVGGW